MTEILKTALVGYSTRQMFDLINDIEAYPQYMTGVAGVEVYKREPALVEARLDLCAGKLKQSFATRNTLVAPESMTMELLEGPFKTFAGVWRFQALAEDACKVSLELKFEFSNRLLALASGPLFEKLANQQVDALCRRAEQVYG